MKSTSPQGGVFVPERGFVAIFCRKRRTGSGALSRLRRECVPRASRGRRTQAHRVASVASVRGAAFRGRFRGRSERGGERRSGGMAERVEERLEGADQGWSQVREGRESLDAVGKGSEARERGTGGARGAIGAAPEARERGPGDARGEDPDPRGARARGSSARGRASGPFCAAALDRAIGRLLYWGAAFVARVLRARRHAR